MYVINSYLSSIIISEYERITGYSYTPQAEFSLSFDNAKDIFKLFEEVNRSLRVNPGLPECNSFTELSDLVEVMELDFVSKRDGTILARFPGIELDIF